MPAENASVLSILNEDGDVLYTRIVPSTKHEHVKEAFDEIYSTPGRTVVTAHIFTDNFHADNGELRSTWRRHHPNQPPSLLRVGQDHLHAKQRLLRPLDAKHPDFRSASHDLSAVFKSIRLGDITTVQEAKQAFIDWRDKYLKQRPETHDFDGYHRAMAMDLPQQSVDKPGVTAKLGSEFMNIIDDEMLRALLITHEELQTSSSSSSSSTTALLAPIATGASANEVWHRFLKEKKRNRGGCIGYDTLDMFLSLLAHQYNLRSLLPAPPAPPAAATGITHSPSCSCHNRRSECKMPELPRVPVQCIPPPKLQPTYAELEGFRNTSQAADGGEEEERALAIAYTSHYADGTAVELPAPGNE